MKSRRLKEPSREGQDRGKDSTYLWQGVRKPD